MIARQICKEVNGVSIPICDLVHDEKNHNDFLIDYCCFLEYCNVQEDNKPTLQEWFSDCGYQVTTYEERNTNEGRSRKVLQG